MTGFPPSDPGTRFWPKVDRRGPDDCWLWTACRTPCGYGQFGLPGRLLVLAHRWSWEDANGPIPEGIFVLHRCDVPACVNPAHLFLGTQRDNMRDMAAKGRHRVPALRGEQNHATKLSAADVTAIRERSAAGGVTYKQLGREFGVSGTAIGNVVKGLAHVESNRISC